MKSGSLIVSTLLFILANPILAQQAWLHKTQESYSVYYTIADNSNLDSLLPYFVIGKSTVSEFSDSTFKNDFRIYIHPNRQSLDSTWQKDWNLPGFQSECWMVASGVASRLDLLSPRQWPKQACEHDAADTLETQKLITHEMIHVFHGQYNPSPDFSDISGIDWLVEGMATYASGQCDEERVSEVKKAVMAGEITQGLDKFWTGRLRYGLSGTLVEYIDKTYGRSKLIELLKYNRIEQVFQALNTTEALLLDGWKSYIKGI